MTINVKHQYKVILLMAGYLFIVLNHLYFIEPPLKLTKQKTFNAANLVPKGYDKFGRGVVTVKKIYKSVINRDLEKLKCKALSDLYVAELLYNVSPTNLQSKLYVYTPPATDLPVRREFHLRI